MFGLERAQQVQKLGMKNASLEDVSQLKNFVLVWDELSRDKRTSVLAE